MNKSTIIGLVITSIWIIVGFIWGWYKNFSTLDLNEQGDFLAGIVAPLAFFWFILAYFLQKEELKENTEALKGQELQLLETKEQFKNQQFENSFFELFKMFKSISSSLSGEVEPPASTGRWVPQDFNGAYYFDGLKDYFRDEFDGEFGQLVKETDRALASNRSEKEILLEQVDLVYDKIYNGKESVLGHYFRSLYHLLKYIDEFDIIDKQKYFNIVQAFLSDSELYVIFYNGIGRYGRYKLLPLLDKYTFLENIRPKGVEFNLHMKTFYPNTFKKYSAKQIFPSI